MIKMPLGTQVGRGPRHIALDWKLGHSPTQKGAQQPPIFSPCLLWPNGWIDQDATRYGGRLQTRLHYVRCGPSSPNGKGHSSPLLYGPLSIVAKRSPISATAELLLAICSLRMRRSGYL